MTTETTPKSTRKRRFFRTLALAAWIATGAFGVVSGLRADVSSGTVTAATSWTFRREVLHADLPVVVEFWAPWCGPCRQLAPRLDKLAGDLRGVVKFVRVNIEDSPLYTDLYNVKQLPTLLVVRNGKVATRLEGGAELRSLFDRLEKVASEQQARPLAVTAALAP